MSSELNSKNVSTKCRLPQITKQMAGKFKKKLAKKIKERKNSCSNNTPMLNIWAGTNTTANSSKICQHSGGGRRRCVMPSRARQQRLHTLLNFGSSFERLL